MDRLVSGSVIFTCLLVLCVGATGVGAALSTGSAPVSESVSTPSVATAVSTNGDEPTNATNSTNVTDVDPTFTNVTVPVEDAEPFEFGTTVVVREKTLQSMVFQADESDIPGNVSVRESQLDAVDGLAENRTVHDAIDLTVPDSAVDVPTTLRLVVHAHPVDNHENLEVVRYNDGSWEPLETTVASNRTWSSDRDASVLLIEAETPGFSTFAVTETDDSETQTEVETETQPINETDIEPETETTFMPPAGADIYRITDRKPFEFGTHMHIHEETIREITFNAENDKIEGYVAINESNSTAVTELRDERSVIRAINITATENASRTSATLHATVRAIDVDSRDDVELMRYDADQESWDELQTEVVSERFWSADHSASVFRVDAKTPGFSTFAVTQRPVDSEPEDPEPDPESEQQADDTPDDSGLLFGFGFLQLAVVVVVIIGGFGAAAIVRRR